MKKGKAFTVYGGLIENRPYLSENERHHCIMFRIFGDMAAIYVHAHIYWSQGGETGQPLHKNPLNIIIGLLKLSESHKNML
jgi:hypothetical protein